MKDKNILTQFQKIENCSDGTMKKIKVKVKNTNIEEWCEMIDKFKEKLISNGFLGKDKTHFTQKANKMTICFNDEEIFLLNFRDVKKCPENFQKFKIDIESDIDWYDFENKFYY